MIKDTYLTMEFRKILQVKLLKTIDGTRSCKQLCEKCVIYYGHVVGTLVVWFLESFCIPFTHFRRFSRSRFRCVNWLENSISNVYEHLQNCRFGCLQFLNNHLSAPPGYPSLSFPQR